MAAELLAEEEANIDAAASSKTPKKKVTQAELRQRKEIEEEQKKMEGEEPKVMPMIAF